MRFAQTPNKLILETHNSMKSTHNATPAFHFLTPAWLDETDSTNSEIKRRLLESPDLPSGTVAAARFQSGGKGRMGNAWYAAPDSCLMFSFLWKGAVRLDKAGTLPMACSLAIADFLRDHAIHASCKWPNDVLVGDAKICGILTEAPSARDGVAALIVGIGVNLRDDPERDRRLGLATASMESASGERLLPSPLLPELLRHLERRIDAWNVGGFAAIMDDFLTRMWGMGVRLRVRTPSGPVYGRIAGMGENGELRLESETGDAIVVNSAAALDPGP